MKIDETFLKLSAQRAFLFNIPPTVRQISVDISQGPLINALVCSSEILDEDDRESIYSAFAEICGDFPEAEVDSDIIFEVSDTDIMNIRRFPILLFSLSR